MSINIEWFGGWEMLHHNDDGLENDEEDCKETVGRYE